MAGQSLKMARALLLLAPLLAAVRIPRQNSLAPIVSPNPLQIADFGAIGDGVADDTGAIQLALDSAPDGSVLTCPSAMRFYKLTHILKINHALTLSGTCELHQTALDTGGIKVTSSRVRIQGITLKGVQYAKSRDSETGILIAGPDVSHLLSEIEVTNTHIANWGQEGIHVDFVSSFEIDANEIHDVWYAGIGVTQSSLGWIRHNIVTTVPGSPNAYGIYLSRSSSADTDRYPRSSRIQVSDNTVENIPNWECYDTHGGKSIQFIGNRGYGCRIGIMAGSSNVAGKSLLGAVDVTILGNFLESHNQNGGAGYGIVFTGADKNKRAIDWGIGVIANNTVVEYGFQSNIYSGALYIHDTMGLVVKDNSIIDPSPNGIALYYNNVGFIVTGNTVMDPWSASKSGTAIALTAFNNRGEIYGNNFVRASKSAASVCAAGISVASGSTNHATIGTNHDECRSSR